MRVLGLIYSKCGVEHPSPSNRVKALVFVLKYVFSISGNEMEIFNIFFSVRCSVFIYLLREKEVAFDEASHWLK